MYKRKHCDGEKMELYISRILNSPEYLKVVSSVQAGSLYFRMEMWSDWFD
jgi:hypothetical protein